MKKVLIVDDTSVVRSFLTRALKPHADDFQVITAKNGQEAVVELKSSKIDLVMTDLEMPVMDGFELLAYMSNNHPAIPVFVMTANGNPDIEARINALGSIRYFEKPMDIEHLSKCIHEELNSGAKGQIQGIGLASFLQLVDMEKKTCTLTITSKGKTGNIYCQKGDLIAAETGNLKNVEAAYELITWDNAIIEIKNTIGDIKRDINMSLMKILMEGLKIKDEKDANKAKSSD